MLPDEIREWFRLADTDLALAEYVVGMDPQPLEAIGHDSDPGQIPLSSHGAWHISGVS